MMSNGYVEISLRKVSRGLCLSSPVTKTIDAEKSELLGRSVEHQNTGALEWNSVPDLYELVVARLPAPLHPPHLQSLEYPPALEGAVMLVARDGTLCALY